MVDGVHSAAPGDLYHPVDFCVPVGPVFNFVGGKCFENIRRQGHSCDNSMMAHTEKFGSTTTFILATKITFSFAVYCLHWQNPFGKTLFFKNQLKLK